jgi:hypothetical protein
MTSEERAAMDETFLKIAETRRPSSIEWLESHRERMNAMRLDPEVVGYQIELMRAKLEDVQGALNALLARLSPDGQRGLGHIGRGPVGRG